MENEQLAGQLIRKLFERYGKKLTDEAFEDYKEVLTKFREELCLSVLKHVRKHYKAFPSPAELEKELISSQKYFESKHPPLVSDLICRYFSPQEMGLSKSMCTTVDPMDAELSMRDFGQPLCNWHYSCMRAKDNPDGSEAKMVRRILMDKKLAKDMGVEDFFMARLGFVPGNDKKYEDLFWASGARILKNEI